MQYEYLSDALDYIQNEIEKDPNNNSIIFEGINLSNTMNDNSTFILIDELKNKYKSTDDTYQLLEQIKSIWNQVPWQIKIELIVICYYTRNKNVDHIITGAILMILTPIRSLFKPLD